MQNESKAARRDKRTKLKAIVGVLVIGATLGSLVYIPWQFRLPCEICGVAIGLAILWPRSLKGNL